MKQQIVSLNLNKMPVNDNDLANIAQFVNLRKTFVLKRLKIFEAVTCGAIRTRLHRKRTGNPGSTFGIISSGLGPACEKAFTKPNGTTSLTTLADDFDEGVKHLAKALHTIEDSYSPGHTKRTSNRN